jgi:ATP-dependent RNA helicase DeaD
MDKDRSLVRLIETENPTSAIIFCNTKARVHYVNVVLQRFGYDADELSSDLTQAMRESVLDRVRAGSLRFLVATDVAARGLDLPGVALVLHGDLPRDVHALQHRSGRTGRAGRKGVAVLLATPAERFRLERMLKQLGLRAEWTPVPAPEEIRARDAERLEAEIAALAAEAAEEDREAARRLLAAHEPLAVAVALVRRERARLPAPEELAETPRAAREAPPRERREKRAPPADVVWFRLLMGRERQADPRWILPLLCRRGEVARDAIGKIQVLPRETRFEVARAVAARFEKAARRPDPRMPEARIERLAGGPAAGAARHRTR